MVAFKNIFGDTCFMNAHLENFLKTIEGNAAHAAAQNDERAASAYRAMLKALYPKIAADLKTKAAADMAQWPQYKGHFDGYQLARVKRSVKTKMGLAFEAGEVVIAVKAAFQFPGHPASVTAYSARNKCDTGLTSRDVEWLS